MAGRTALMSGRMKNPAGVTMEDSESVVKSWVRIIGYMGRYKHIFIFAVTLAVFESLFSVLVPNRLSDMTDIIEVGLTSGNIDLYAVSRLGILAFGLYLASTLVMFFRYRLTSSIAQRVGGNLREDMAGKMNRLPLGYIDTQGKGDIMSRFANDTDTVSIAINNSMGVFIHGIAAFTLCIVMMFLTDVRLTLTVLVTSAMGIIMSVVVIKYTQKYYRKQQSNIGGMYRLVSEMYSSKQVVMAYCGETSARRKFDRINSDLRESCLKSEITIGLLPAAMSFMNSMSYVLVCIVGALMVLNGEIKIGVIVAFIVYVRLFSGPFDMITSSIGRIQSAAAAAERVFGFLDQEEIPSENDDVEPVGNVRGRVEFRDVRFSYKPGKEIIHGFSAVVEPGQKVAIVGPTGAGKTTIVNLLMRFYEMDSGDILIDGRSIRDMTRTQVHDLFCMVLQDTWLFDGTVTENIAYCNDVSDEDVRNACRAIGVEDHILNLPDGYDTILGENIGLSAGQKQQITIARAMVDRSPMLILDEATSSVDTRTEKLIQDALSGLMVGRTSFIIAHRLSTIRDSDLILVMDKGDIVEQGTHDDLLSRDTFYARLYNSQFDR